MYMALGTGWHSALWITLPSTESLSEKKKKKRN